MKNLIIKVFALFIAIISVNCSKNDEIASLKIASLKSNIANATIAEN